MIKFHHFPDKNHFLILTLITYPSKTMNKYFYYEPFSTNILLTSYLIISDDLIIFSISNCDRLLRSEFE